MGEVCLYTKNTRWGTNCSSKVNLPHAIQSRALRGAFLVTQNPKIQGVRTPHTALSGTYTLHCDPASLYPKPKPCISTPCTLTLHPYTLNHNPASLQPTPLPCTPTPQTLALQPYIVNLQLEIQVHVAGLEQPEAAG